MIQMTGAGSRDWQKDLGRERMSLMAVTLPQISDLQVGHSSLALVSVAPLFCPADPFCCSIVMDAWMHTLDEAILQELQPALQRLRSLFVLGNAIILQAADGQ